MKLISIIWVVLCKCLFKLILTLTAVGSESPGAHGALIALPVVNVGSAVACAAFPIAYAAQ